MLLPLLAVLCIVTLLAGTAVYAEVDFVSSFGKAGTGIDELHGPTDVILNTDDNTIYVTDSENHRVNVFEDDGDHDFEFGSFCSIFSIQSCNDNANGADDNGDGQFDTPSGIAVDKHGNYYVVDSENYRVQKFDDDGRFVLKFGSSDSGLSEYLAAPRGIAILDATGDIFVSGISEDSITVFDSAGNFAYSFDSYDNDNFNNPRYLLIKDDMMYVADSGNDMIVMFQLVTTSQCHSSTTEVADGVCFVEKFGTTGSGDGEFNSPAGLALDETNNLLYVADTNNDRIQSFRISDTCPSNTKEVADGVCFVEKFGTTGSGDGEFNSPAGLALDETNNLLYVADTNNDRIQVLSLSAISSLAPIPPSDLHALPLSPTSLMIIWSASDASSDITGYKIEYKDGSGNYQTINDDTKTTTTYFIHNGLDQETSYTYRVSAINSEGTSNPSSSNTASPQHTDTPAGLTAYAISPSQVKLTWHPPTNTFGQSISGYEVKRVVSTGVYDTIATVDSGSTTYTVSDLQTDKNYSFVVSANLGSGSTNESNVAEATPKEDSKDDLQSAGSFTTTTTTVPSAPNLSATAPSSTQVNLSWSVSDDGNSEITGYKIEVRKDSGSFVTLVADTQSTSRSYQHTGLSANSQYSYRVYAINSEGTSDSSNTASVTLKDVLRISPIGKLTVDEKNTLSFSAKITDSSITGVSFSLDSNAPAGATINANTGMFSWTPTASQGSNTYTFGIIAKTNSMTDSQSVSITVNDVESEPKENLEPKDSIPKPPSEPVEPKTPANTVASFVDTSKDPQYYVDRYNNEPTYKKWFDDNYSEYDSIYQAVGVDEPLTIPAPFVDTSKDPQYYVDRYNNEPTYKKWFDDNYSEYSSINEAVGIPDEQKPKKEYGYCGTGTKLIDGVCMITEIPREKPWWQFW